MKRELRGQSLDVPSQIEILQWSIINFRNYLTGQMTERLSWTVQEDSLLKEVFEQSGLKKWSHIARQLQEHGVRGKNGKHCKQRYLRDICGIGVKDEWSYEVEQRMFELHNQLGNRWAIIGSQLDGRSDNSIKNHFYSILRKGLRKVNQALKILDKKQIKQFKPTVLYRIIQVSEEKFKFFQNYEEPFATFASKLKSDLIQFSYDDEVDFGKEYSRQESINLQQARELINEINEFGSKYKKKLKKSRKTSLELKPNQNLLKPDRYLSEEESSFNASSLEISQGDNQSQLSNINHNSNPKYKRARKSSEDSTSFCPLDRVATRTYSQTNTQDNSESSRTVPAVAQTKMEVEVKKIEGDFEGLNIIQEEDIAQPILLKRESSKYSDFHQEREDYSFFEDSQMQIRILPELDLGYMMDEQLYEGMFL